MNSRHSPTIDFSIGFDAKNHHVTAHFVQKILIKNLPDQNAPAKRIPLIKHRNEFASQCMNFARGTHGNYGPLTQSER